MRYTKFNLLQVSGFILGFFSLIGCGSYQNSSYYSDGIYGNRDVVVIRRQAEQPSTTATTNSYSQYFDEKAKEYQWDTQEDNVALTQIDSLTQQKDTNYQSQPQWGGGNNTTQIVFVDNSPNFGFGGFGGFGFGNNFGYGGFYDPYPAPWNWPYRFNNPNYFNRFGGGFYNPYYSPYGGFYRGYGSFYNNPFYGGYGSFYRNPYYRVNNRNNRIAYNNRKRSRAYSSTYRGQASSRAGVRRLNIAPAQGTQATASSNSRSSTVAQNNSAQTTIGRQATTSVPNLVQTGRRATQARRSSQLKSNNETNSAYIDRVIRSYQTRGYNVDVIRDPVQARRAISRQNNQNYSNTSSVQGKSSPSSRRSNESNNTYTAPKRTNTSSSSRSSSPRSSSSRSSSSVRSSSSRSSSGRSSSSRRQ